MRELQFSIDYKTYGNPDARLRIEAEAIEGGGKLRRISKELVQTGDGQWTVSLRLNGDCDLSYTFSLVAAGKTIDCEAKGYHHQLRIEGAGKLCIRSYWNTADDNSYLYTKAYRDAILPQYCGTDSPVDGRCAEPSGRSECQLVVDNIPVPQGKKMVVTGSSEQLGHWIPQRGLAMQGEGRRHSVDIKAEAEDVEYKFVLIDQATGAIEWEEGCNRILPATDGHCRVIEHSRPAFHLSPIRIAGVMLPLFSLRAAADGGVGDFGAMYKFVDWAASVGLRLIQILPINDTTATGTWRDSYPYSSITAFAIHPMYYHVSEWPASLKAERQRLNAMPQVDYEAINRLKTACFDLHYAEQGEAVAGTDGYKAFVKDNSHWLTAYCYFRILTEQMHTADSRQWGELAEYDERRVGRWIARHGLKDRVRYYSVLQYELYSQLIAVHDYANCHGIALKGDLPIGIARDSATTWSLPQYFNLDGQAGAPPDYFSSEGQNWGFPTYDWNRILDDGGSWWRERTRFMSRYYDALRIDHVLGFFRIWEIPYTYIYGTTGHFAPARPYTINEIRQWGYEAPVTPVPQFCHDELQQAFGDRAKAVISKYFRKAKQGDETVYTIRYTQRELHDMLPDDECLYRQLSEMLCNLLFVTTDGLLYHPAIDGGRTKAFQQLSDKDRYIYGCLSYDYFHLRHNQQWAEEALRRLPAVTEGSDMLFCAEDLGFIPPCVPGILQKFKVLSLEVQSMPKRAEGRFACVDNNPMLSVDTITTHDMMPLRLWWQTCRGDADALSSERLQGRGWGSADLHPDVARYILQQHLQSPSLLCVIALQDFLAMDAGLRNDDTASETVNNPANPNHYWRYRMHLTIEQLQQATNYNANLVQLLQYTGRTV